MYHDSDVGGVQYGHHDGVVFLFHGSGSGGFAPLLYFWVVGGDGCELI